MKHGRLGREDNNGGLRPVIFVWIVIPERSEEPAFALY
jgi:hypothetical protein